MSTPDDDAAPDPPDDAATARLTALWDAHAVRVHAYTLRHADPDTAQDLLSETFLVAWRRLADVPADPLPWLIVVARNLLRNDHRAQARRRELATELARLERAAPAVAGAPESLAAEREELLRGLAALSEKEREALLLVAWDGLGPTRAAEVAGCTTATLHVRLHRARRRLAAAVDEAGTDGSGTRPNPSDGGTRAAQSPTSSRRSA